MLQKPLGETSVGGGQNLDGQDSRVYGAWLPDCGAGNRDSARHLNDRQQRIQTAQTGAGDRDSNHRQNSMRGNYPPEMGGASGGHNDYFQASLRRGARVFRGPVR